MKAVNRFSVILIIALIVSVVLPMGAYAAVGDDGGGFSLWDLLDGLGGFFRGLTNAIGRFITSVISAIKNGVNATIGAIQKLITAVGDGINYILSGLKSLFIPSKQSFSKFRDDILANFDNKFGSVFSALDYLGKRFKNLGAKSDLRNVFKVAFPSSSFLNGISIDFLAVASPVLAFIRFCITGICCLVTALTCYNKVIEVVNT